MPYTKSYEEFDIEDLPEQLKILSQIEYPKKGYILVFRGCQRWPGNGDNFENLKGDRFTIKNSRKIGIYNICDKEGQELEINGEYYFTGSDIEKIIEKWSRKFSVIGG
jgi:hypothetical protein